MSVSPEEKIPVPHPGAARQSKGQAVVPFAVRSLLCYCTTAFACRTHGEAEWSWESWSRSQLALRMHRTPAMRRRCRHAVRKDDSTLGVNRFRRLRFFVVNQGRSGSILLGSSNISVEDTAVNATKHLKGQNSCNSYPICINECLNCRHKSRQHDTRKSIQIAYIYIR